MKQIPMQLTPIQKEMLDNGASYVIYINIDQRELEYFKRTPIDTIIFKPLKEKLPQIGDEIFFQEKILICDECCELKDDCYCHSGKLISKTTTYEQSRYKYPILDIEIVECNNLLYEQIQAITSKDFGDLDEMLYYLKDKFLNCKDLDNDNPYVALIKIKE